MAASSPGVRLLISTWGSPHRLRGASRPFAVVALAADAVVAERRQDLAGAGQALGVDMARRVPQFRTHQRAGALEIDCIDLDHRHGARRLAVYGEGGEQGRLDAEMGAAGP